MRDREICTYSRRKENVKRGEFKIDGKTERGGEKKKERKKEKEKERQRRKEREKKRNRGRKRIKNPKDPKVSFDLEN